MKMKEKNTSLKKLMLKEAGTFSHNYRVFSLEIIQTQHDDHCKETFGIRSSKSPNKPIEKHTH